MKFNITVARTVTEEYLSVEAESLEDAENKCLGGELVPDNETFTNSEITWYEGVN